MTESERRLSQFLDELIGPLPAQGDLIRSAEEPRTLTKWDAQMGNGMKEGKHESPRAEGALQLSWPDVDFMRQL